MPRTALVVVVPEAEPLVYDWRYRHDSGALGVPAHITLLFPFVPTEHLDERLLRELRALFAKEKAFAFSLPRVGRFPRHAWLAPEPSAPFVALTRRIVERYPEYQPYDGAFTVDELVPHLTVVEGDKALQDEVEIALRPHLPISAAAREVALLVEDHAARWRVRRTFPLGADAPSPGAGQRS
jgi:2'-5' RNA ligase